MQPLTILILGGLASIIAFLAGLALMTLGKIFLGSITLIAFGLAAELAFGSTLLRPDRRGIIAFFDELDRLLREDEDDALCRSARAL